MWTVCALGILLGVWPSPAKLYANQVHSKNGFSMCIFALVSSLLIFFSPSDLPFCISLSSFYCARPMCHHCIAVYQFVRPDFFICFSFLQYFSRPLDIIYSWHFAKDFIFFIFSLQIYLLLDIKLRCKWYGIILLWYKCKRYLLLSKIRRKKSFQTLVFL